MGEDEEKVALSGLHSEHAGANLIHRSKTISITEIVDLEYWLYDEVIILKRPGRM